MKITVINVLFQVIQEGPRSVNVSLGSKARFTCTCEGEGITVVWTINDISHDNAESINRGVETPLTINIAKGRLLSMVNISALRVNDGVSIQCVAIAIKTSAYSDAAVMRVQGLLYVARRLHCFHHNNYYFHSNTLL